jgi:hypothetical protein
MFIFEKKCSREPAGQFQSKVGTINPWVKEILEYTNKGPGPLQRGDNHKNAKIWRGHGKSFSLRTTEPELLIFLWKLSEIVQI